MAGGVRHCWEGQVERVMSKLLRRIARGWGCETGEFNHHEARLAKAAQGCQRLRLSRRHLRTSSVLVPCREALSQHRHVADTTRKGEHRNARQCIPEVQPQTWSVGWPLSRLSPHDHPPLCHLHLGHRTCKRTTDSL